jgi:hypothetical protein
VARRPQQKAIVPFQDLPPVVKISDNIYGHFIRYRIVTEDLKKFSHWSPVYAVPIEQPTIVDGRVTASNNVIQVTWDDEINRPAYDVFIQFKLSINQKSLTSNVATLRTTGNHQLAVGDVIQVAGVDSTFNGTYTITAVTAPNLISYRKVAANVTESSASGSVLGPFKYHGTSFIHFYSLINNVTASEVKAIVQVASEEKVVAAFLKIFETTSAIVL